MEVKLNDVISEIFDFTARVTINEKLIMKNQFRLTNVLSSVLSGMDNK